MPVRTPKQSQSRGISRNTVFRPVADRIVDKALRRATADGKPIQLNEEQTAAVTHES